jgi:Recombination endonuclease VII
VPYDEPAMVAVLGDDGRYHLRDGPHMLCGDLRGDVVVHGQSCYWWTDRARSLYRTTAPATHPDRDRGHQFRRARWTVRLSRTVMAPESAPHQMRCPTNPGPWPSYHNPATAIGRIRIQLAAELGRHCHACQRGPAFAVDHDHVTGLVRGMLCRTCNSHIDWCPHLSGCHYADYLNNPPAARLKLTFPQKRGTRLPAFDLLRIEHLGINPFER